MPPVPWALVLPPAEALVRPSLQHNSEERPHGSMRMGVNPCSEPPTTAPVPAAAGAGPGGGGRGAARPLQRIAGFVKVRKDRLSFGDMSKSGY